MMSLEEAIKHCEEVIELNENQARIYNEQGDAIASFSCYECAREHRQLAEWLRELKALRENEHVKDFINDCGTCKYLKLEPNDYPCDRCMHGYINQYVYDDKREVNADEDSD